MADSGARFVRMPPGKNSPINQGRRELIDNILVSAALVKSLDSTTVGAVIPEPLPSVTTTPNTRLDKPSSDHAPIVATFANF